MIEPQIMPQYLKVGEAARLLGVTTRTPRNWDRLGKLEARRHPINGYRIYVRAELEALMNKRPERLESVR